MKTNFNPVTISEVSDSLSRTHSAIWWVNEVLEAYIIGAANDKLGNETFTSVKHAGLDELITSRWDLIHEKTF